MTGRTSRLQPTRTAANLLLCCQSAQVLCHSGVIFLGGGKTSEVLQTLLCCQTRATVLPFASPCCAGRWAVQLSPSRVPPAGAASAVTHHFPRQHKMKLGWVLPAPSLSARLRVALAKADRRRNSRVAAGRADGCVWSISTLPTLGTKRWFVSPSQTESLQHRRLLHVCEGVREDVLSNALILTEWLCGVGFCPLCIKEVSLLTGEFYTRGKKLHDSSNCVLIRC